MEAAKPQFVALTSAPAPYFGMTGDKVAQARERDAAVQRLRRFQSEPDTPEFLQLLEEFKASPATGCVTVLDQLRRRANYNPLKPSPNSLMMFYVYLVQSPLFRQLPFDAFGFEIKVGMGQPTPNPDEVVRRFQGSDGEASRRIRLQYDNLMREAIANPGRTQEGDLLQEHSLGVRQQITFLYIHTTLKVHLAMLPGMVVIGEIMGHRYGMEFAFETAKWPEHAEAVLREDLRAMDDWDAGRW